MVNTKKYILKIEDLVIERSEGTKKYNLKQDSCFILQVIGDTLTIETHSGIIKVIHAKELAYIYSPENRKMYTVIKYISNGVFSVENYNPTVDVPIRC